MTAKRDPRATGAVAVPSGTQKIVTQPEPEIDTAKLQEQIRHLESLLAQQSQSGLPRRLGFRIAPKGGISVYGLNANFPVTLYYEQWMRLREQMDELEEFAEANKDLLDMRDDPPDILRDKQDKRQSMGIVARQQPRTERIQTEAASRKVA